VDRDQKAAVVDEIAGQIEQAQAIFAVDYRGISVPEAAELRERLRPADATFRIVKNSLTERAADKAGADTLAPLLDGPTALTFVKGDAALAAVARCLRERCGEAGTVYRIGGDEFAGIWDGASTDAVRTMLSLIDADLSVLGEDLQTAVRISWGVATFDAQHAFADALIAADTRLYDSRTVRSGLTVPLRRG